MKSKTLKEHKLRTIMTTITVIAVLLMTVTYAWFSANRDVSITDITARIVASEGMQISLDGEIWSANIEINKEALTNANGNFFSWPDKLVPVSTDGSTDSGRLNLSYGVVGKNGDVLTDVEKESDADTTKYISFDLYIKNASAEEEGNNLGLGIGSYVIVNGIDGVENTGLEGSTRVGMVVFEETASITAETSEILGLSAGTTPSVMIWEPNYDKHINEIVINDRRINAANQAFNTWGITSTASSTILQSDTPDGFYYADDIANSITAGEKNPNLESPYTIQTAEQVGELIEIRNVNNEVIPIAANTITKARVYIWLEGQDPDCIDTASTGKVFDVVFNLSK